MLYCVQLLSHVWLLETLWAVVRQAPLSMGFSQARILEWVAISYSKGIFPTFGSNTHVLCLLVDSLPLSHQGSPILYFRESNSFPLLPKKFFFYSILYHNELTSPPDHVFLGGGVLLISVSPPIFRSISTHESYLNPQINPIESCFMFICISHST